MDHLVSGRDDSQVGSSIRPACRPDSQPSSRNWWPADMSEQPTSSNSKVGPNPLFGLHTSCAACTESRGIQGPQHHRGAELAAVLKLLDIDPSNSAVQLKAELPGNNTSSRLSSSPNSNPGMTSVYAAVDDLQDVGTIPTAAALVAPEVANCRATSACSLVAYQGMSSAAQCTPPAAEDVMTICQSEIGGQSGCVSQEHNHLVSDVDVPVVQAASISGTSNARRPLPYTIEPAWARQAAGLLYVAVFLTTESRAVLLGVVPPEHACIHAHHMTLAFKPSVSQLLEYPIGAEVQLHVLGSVVDSKAQAVVVDPPSWLPPTTSACTHVTISVAASVQAVEAGRLLARAMHSNASTQLTKIYKPLPEPLLIVGKVGVMVKAKAGAGWSDDGTIIYSVEDLIQCGYLTMEPDNLQSFHQRQFEFLQQQAPISRVTETMTTTTAGWEAPHVHSPSYIGVWSQVASTSAHAKLGLDHPSSGHRGFAGHPPNDEPQQDSFVASLGYGFVQKHVSDGDTSDGSCGNEYVQFKSAVHIGDYVIVQPFVPGMVHASLVYGYVTEFASDEAFQGDGVLVVLSDNTIGYVIAVEPSPEDGPRHTVPGGCVDTKEASCWSQSQAGTSHANSVGVGEVQPPLSSIGVCVGSEEHVYDVQEDQLLQQLAVCLDLDPICAEQLSKLAPHLPSLQVLDVLQQCDGDVNKAANILLAGGDGVLEEAATTTNMLTPRSWTSVDGAMVARIGHLRSMHPELSQDTAQLLLQEHQGDVNEVLEVLSDMQTSELLARTAAASGATTAGTQEHAWVSEEDQLAIIAALGLLGEESQQGASSSIMRTCARAQAPAQEGLRGAPRPKSATRVAMPRTSAQRPTTAPARAQRPPSRVTPKYDSSEPSLRSESAVPPTTSSLVVGDGHLIPPKPACKDVRGEDSVVAKRSAQAMDPRPHAKQQVSFSGGFHQESYHEQPLNPDLRKNKVAAEAEVDKLYTRSKSLIKASELYMVMAQVRLKAGDFAGFKTKKAAAEKAKAEGRALFEQAQRVSWSANNPQQQALRIDLHGQGTSRALQRFVEQLNVILHLDSPGGIQLLVITGKGNHSEGNVGKIKLNVLKYLEERAMQVRAQSGTPWRVKWQIDPSNEGCIVVTIDGRPDTKPIALESAA